MPQKENQMGIGNFKGPMHAKRTQPHAKSIPQQQQQQQQQQQRIVIDEDEDDLLVNDDGDMEVDAQEEPPKKLKRGRPKGGSKKQQQQILEKAKRTANQETEIVTRKGEDDEESEEDKHDQVNNEEEEEEPILQRKETKIRRSKPLDDESDEIIEDKGAMPDKEFQQLVKERSQRSQQKDVSPPLDDASRDDAIQLQKPPKSAAGPRRQEEDECTMRPLERQAVSIANADLRKTSGYFPTTGISQDIVSNVMTYQPVAPTGTVSSNVSRMRIPECLDITSDDNVRIINQGSEAVRAAAERTATLDESYAAIAKAGQLRNEANEKVIEELKRQLAKSNEDKRIAIREKDKAVEELNVIKTHSASRVRDLMSEIEQLKKEKGPECITIPASPLKGTSTVDALRHLYAHFTGLTITPVDGDADMLEPNEVCYEFKQKGSLGTVTYCLYASIPLNSESHYYYLPDTSKFPAVKLPHYMMDECEFEEIDARQGEGNGQRWVCKVMRTMAGIPDSKSSAEPSTTSKQSLLSNVKKQKSSK